MDVKDFYFDLPEELIAQDPSPFVRWRIRSHKPL